VEKNEISKEEVIQSNKNFYDLIAGVYEKVDTRRNRGLDYSWLRKINDEIFHSLKERFSGELEFVDAGAGSGFLADQAKEYFKKISLIDLSAPMLDKINIPNAKKIVGDCTQMPLPDNSVHYIGAFATLHHLFEPRDLFTEAFRVLKNGGVFYSDHDIEESFVRHFKVPLKVFRFFNDHGPKYIAACPQSKMKDYEISEFHGGTGLSGRKLLAQLKEIGFSEINVTYHWNGGGAPEKILDFLKIKKLLSREGFAPNLRIIARK